MSDTASSTLPTAEPTIPGETESSTTLPSETSTPLPEETSTTAPPEETTTPPPEPTSESSTSIPEETTSTPEPSSTTEEPSSTTEEPSSTTEEPLPTTSEESSTTEPESSTSPSVTVITVTPTTSADTTITITTTSLNTDRSTTSLPPSSTQSSSTSTSATISATAIPASGGGGLSQPAKIAIAIIIPIFGVVLLAFLGIFLWRRHKKRKASEEMRRKEVEEYGYNPNNDGSPGPIALAATGGASQAGGGGGGGGGVGDMAEVEAGYRGWGNTAGGRKASAPLSASAATSNTVGGGGYGNTNFSGAGGPQYQPPQQPELYGSPVAAGAIPVAAGVTGAAVLGGGAIAAGAAAHSDDEAKKRDRHSHSPLLSSPTNRPSTADSSTIGAPPTTTGPSELDDGLQRGDSVASSRYTNATRQSEDSGAHEVPGNNGYRNTYVSDGNDYYNDVANPYAGDYDYHDHAPEQGYHQPPMIQQVGARRNTRIENPPDTHYAQMPRQGTSGIAQNF
ncbi:hypothetical protein TWF730_003389 [Orbilia blumenaviensis]|uniref:Uncharacterized protein n=1 Tax=Orbilia blumenaviensis TaxID=1796055 RepID=A0AAV9U9K5_9PEZI